MPGTQLMLLPQQFLYWSKSKLTYCQGGLTQLQMTSTPICLVSQSTACPLLVLLCFDMLCLLLSEATLCTNINISHNSIIHTSTPAITQATVLSKPNYR